VDLKKPPLMRLFGMAAMKHLPPSAPPLRLIDWSGGALAEIPYWRDDVQVERRRIDADLPADSADAIIALDQALSADALAAGLRALRPGGRLIAIDPAGNLDSTYLARLESAGYTRILVEAALDDPAVAEAPIGVLMRGEKPHLTDGTLERVRIVSERSAEPDDDLENYHGRFVYLLIVQTPNRPIWARGAGEPIRWRAVAAGGAALVFSSLPKAVAFMQRAVLTGQITGVNKIAKFRKDAIASAWTFPLRLNPDLAWLDGRGIALLDIDPSLAEASDE
jgi:hypothetical protein